MVKKKDKKIWYIVGAIVLLLLLMRGCGADTASIGTGAHGDNACVVSCSTLGYSGGFCGSDCREELGDRVYNPEGDDYCEQATDGQPLCCCYT